MLRYQPQDTSAATATSGASRRRPASDTPVVKRKLADSKILPRKPLKAEPQARVAELCLNMLRRQTITSRPTITLDIVLERPPRRGHAFISQTRLTQL